MQKITPSEKIYTAQSHIVPLEKGVFAKIYIKQDEIIEVCPILAISADDTAAIHEESLVSYMFYYGKNKEKSLIALGSGSLYNHAPKPNALYKISKKEKTITFTALTNIAEDEEITVSYAGSTEKPLWFTVSQKEN